MASSLSNLVNNFSEGIQIINYKYGHDDRKCETSRIKYKYCECFLEYTHFKDDLRVLKCLCCNTNYQQKFDVKLKKRFLNTCKFSNKDNNKFISLLRKIIIPYGYMDGWEKLNETSLPEKEDFYNQLFYGHRQFHCTHKNI